MALGEEREIEPSIEELLDDPVVRALMKADGLDARDLIALIEAVSRNWRAHHRETTAATPTKRRRA